MEDEVLLLKQFMKGCGVYGSELKNQGFAGYLVELLVIHYGSFADVLKAASRWHHPVVIEDFVVYADEGCARNRGFGEPLIVIDPTDPNRNVAAAVSLTRMYEFVDAARSFIQNPDKEYFFPKSSPAKTPAELKDIRRIRGSHLCALVVDLPDMVDDVLYPQLRKTEQSITALLQRNDFSIIGSDVHLSESFVNPDYDVGGENGICGEIDSDASGIDWKHLRTATVVFELLCSEIAGVERRMGPPVHVGMNAESFKDKHKDDPKDLSQVYIEGDRFMVDVARQYTTAQALIEGNIHGISTGKHARVGLKRSFDILCDDELIDGATADFCAVLTRLYLKTR
ncbi:MAG: CCA tRNA nucleotidyltransferase, partial [Methanosarcinales archaeon]|nr:CCA tRNA nucleotidyltransferase [Methanosarcinales archaeon]